MAKRIDTRPQMTPVAKLLVLDGAIGMQEGTGQVLHLEFQVGAVRFTSAPSAVQEKRAKVQDVFLC